MNTQSTELGDIQVMAHVIESLRGDDLVVESGGRKIEISGKLGGGGTKSVYDASDGGESFGLALPNQVDSADTALEKWKFALNEPENTRKVLSLGLLANPKCEKLPVTINGADFPAIRMVRYSDLPYKVMDGKNPTSSTVGGTILAEELDVQRFTEYFSTVVDDIRTMIENGVQVGGDSINIALLDGGPRIFLGDLGKAKFEEIGKEERRMVAKYYVESAFSAFLNGMPHSEYENSREFFRGEYFDPRNENGFSSKLLNERLTIADLV